MKKIYLLEKNLVEWSLSADKKNVEFFLSTTDSIFTKNIFKADIIYSVWYETLLSHKYFFLLNFLKKIKNIKVIATVTNDTTIYDKKVIDKLKLLVNYLVVPNEKVYNFIKSNNLKVQLIPFYVDRKIFKKVDMPKEEICKTLQINYQNIKDRFLIGSFQRDSLGSDLTKPKWQKNPDLLIKILNELPKDKFLLILTGPRRHYIIRECEKFNISYLFYGDKKYIDELKDDLVVNDIGIDKVVLLYNLIDLYIVSSKSEGGPKAVLESSLTKTLIVATKVGLAPDMLHGELIYEEENYWKIVNFIKDIIAKKINVEKYIDYNYQKVNDALNEEKLINKYKSLIENV